MSFSLPYSKKRRYLTGIDWILGALDYGARRRIGLGGFSQAILDCQGTLDHQLIASALDQISQALPGLHGRVARDWLNLAPYWKVPPASSVPRSIPLEVIDLPEERSAEADSFLDEHVNHPFPSSSHHLRFLLIRIGNARSLLGMVFDHRLLDAFGAEAMFRLIDLTGAGKLSEIVPNIRLTEPAHLDHWPRRLQSGRVLNEFLRNLNRRSVAALKMPEPGLRRRIRFVHESLTLEETRAFNERASEEVGIPLALPAAAARAVVAMRSVFPVPPLPGEDWLLFTSASARLPGQEWEKMFFNQFSMMTFSARADSEKSAPEIAADLRDQVFEQMKKQIPFVMQDAGALGRICPHFIGSRLMSTLCDGRFCSFYFACLKDSGYPGQSFLGLPVSNLTHKPLVFTPPGLNICMTTYGGKFNLVISFVEGAMQDETATELMKRFKANLASSNTP